MHADLQKLIQQFNECQSKAVSILEAAGIPRTATNDDWDGTRVRMIRDANYFSDRSQFTVKPHGYGMAFWNDEFWIDFDFGDKGQITGFDKYRLARFSKNNDFAVNCLTIILARRLKHPLRSER